MGISFHRTPLYSKYDVARPRIDTTPMNDISAEPAPNPGLEEQNVVGEKKGPSRGFPATNESCVEGRRSLMSLSQISMGRIEPQTRNLSRI